MMARFKDGSVRELEKDCSCTNHDGPHWLHVDEMTRIENKKLLDIKSFLGCQGFAVEEKARLDAKASKMTALGIVDVLR